MIKLDFDLLGENSGFSGGKQGVNPGEPPSGEPVFRGAVRNAGGAGSERRERRERGAEPVRSPAERGRSAGGATSDVKQERVPRSRTSL